MWLALVLALAAPARAAELNAQALVALAAVAPGEAVRFVEHRSNKLLDEPLTFSGVVEMTADGALRRVVQAPFHETATIREDTATLERDGRTRRVKLDRHPRATAYLQSLRSLLRGDHDALARTFDMVATGDLEAWQLALTPLNGAAHWLGHITISGGERLERIRMERPDGSWQDMQLVHGTP